MTKVLPKAKEDVKMKKKVLAERGTVADGKSAKGDTKKSSQ